MLFTSPPPCTSHVGHVSATVVRPLRVAAGFHPGTAAGAAPVTAELMLSNARIPVGGGSFQFYLVDPKAASKAVAIGKLAFEGPATAQVVRNLRVHVELDAGALAILREAASPSIRIVPRHPDGQPLLVQSIQLHDAPQ